MKQSKTSTDSMILNSNYQYHFRYDNNIMDIFTKQVTLLEKDTEVFWGEIKRFPGFI